MKPGSECSMNCTSALLHTVYLDSRAYEWLDTAVYSRILADAETSIGNVAAWLLTLSTLIIRSIRSRAGSAHTPPGTWSLVHGVDFLEEVPGGFFEVIKLEIFLFWVQ